MNYFDACFFLLVNSRCIYLKEKALKGGNAKVQKSMKDYSKEDFFVKKS